MTIEHIQPSEFEQIGQLLARCEYVEVSHISKARSPLFDNPGYFVATVQITPRGMFVKAKGTTQLDAIRNAVEAAEQGVGE